MHAAAHNHAAGHDHRHAVRHALVPPGAGHRAPPDPQIHQRSGLPRSAARRLDVLQKNRAQKWLSDDRANAVLRPEDVDWSHQFWFPQTVQAGWKYWAIVQPEKVVGQVTMKGLATEYGRQGVTSRTFTDPGVGVALARHALGSPVDCVPARARDGAPTRVPDAPRRRPRLRYLLARARRAIPCHGAPPSLATGLLNPSRMCSRGSSDPPLDGFSSWPHGHIRDLAGGGHRPARAAGLVQSRRACTSEQTPHR